LGIIHKYFTSSTTKASQIQETLKLFKTTNYIIKTTLHDSQTTQLVSDIEKITIANVLQPTFYDHSKTTFILHN